MNPDVSTRLKSLPAVVDVLILGAGGAGYPAAFFLARSGKSVLLVDPIGNLGGDCLAEGCVPSKAMREAALVRALANKFGNFGLRGDKPAVDWRAVLAHKDRVQSTRYAQHREEIAQGGALFVQGRGAIVAPNRARIDAADGDTREVGFRHLILGTGSAELTNFLHASLAQRVRIELSAQVTAIERARDGYAVRYTQNGKQHSVQGDAVLMASGRVAVLPEGIDHLGVQMERGHVVVDGSLRSSNPQVWAPGDVNGRSMLFHSAVRQSLVVAHCIAAGGQAVDRMHFDAVPMTVFTEPELAHVGLTSARAEDALGAGEVAVTRYDYAQDSRAQIYGETQGFIKLVFSRKDARLLGAQIAGMDAAQLIAPLALALERNLDARALATTSFPHPMPSEGINKAARAFQP